MFCRGIRESPLSTSPRWSTRARALLLLGPRKDQVLSMNWFFDTPSRWIVQTAHKLDTSHPQELCTVFVPPITTEPSRWWRSPRVTSKELSIDPNKALESGGCIFELLELTREEFTQEISQILILSRLLLLSCTTRWFSVDQMSKRPPMDEMEEYKYFPSSPRAGHSNFTENECTGHAWCCTGHAPQRVRCPING